LEFGVDNVSLNGSSDDVGERKEDEKEIKDMFGLAYFLAYANSLCNFYVLF
jgi:hypothetical protein